MHWDRRTVLASLACTALPVSAIGDKSQSAVDGFITLEAAEAKLRLAPAPTAETAVWAFGGTVPGPVLRVKKSAEVKVRLVNKLAQPTSL